MIIGVCIIIIAGLPAYEGLRRKNMAVTSDTIMDNSLLIMIYLTFIEAFIK